MTNNRIPREAARKLVEFKLKQGFKPDGFYEYYQSNGKIFFRIRLKHPQTGEKIFWPMHQQDNGEYILKEPKFEGKRPLYLSHVIQKRPNESVWVHEGEKCADATYKLDLLSTTSGGNTSAQKADWEILSNRDVIIWPDNDDGGLRYAHEVKEILLSLGCTVRIVDIKKLNLPEKGDVVNYLIAHPNSIKEDLFALPMLLCSSSENIKDEWPEPEKIENKLLPVEPLSIEIIPAPLRDFIIDESERMQCPPDFIAIPLIQIISSIVGCSCGVKPKQNDNWLIIPNLWGAIIGSPGKLKSPAIAAVLSFLEDLEKEEKEKHEEAMKGYEIDIAIFKAEKTGLLNKITELTKKKSAKETDRLEILQLKEELRNLKEPNKPLRKRFKSNDATIEKLSELLSENPNGLLLHRDELIGLLMSWEKSGHESDRAFFLEAWNGNGTHTTDRIGRGTIDTPNMCLSIFGSSQPDKLLRYLVNAINGDNDGLIQRFQLFVYPDDTQWKLVDIKPNIEAKKQTFNIIRYLAYMYTSFLQQELEPGERRTLHFSPEAQSEFYTWIVELEQMKIQSDDHPLIIEHLSKYRKLMPALALLFQLIDLADAQQSNPTSTKQSDQISVENTTKAIAWCKYLESHARRLYGLATNIDAKAASLLADKILKGKLQDGFTVRDVYRQNWSIINNKARAQAACNELIEAGWLCEKITECSTGKTRKITYSINPKIIRKVH